jgi:hypothetical protein
MLQSVSSSVCLLIIYLSSAYANSFIIRSSATQSGSQPDPASNDTTTFSSPPFFLSNGSLSTNVSFTCPGTVDGSNCPALYYCTLPAGTTGELVTVNSTNSSSQATNCSTPISILSTLGVLNVLDAAFSLLLGHKAVRAKIPKLPCMSSDDEDRWTPVSGLIGAFLHILPMLISAGISKAHNQGMTFRSIFGLWTMRPRSNLLVFVIVRSMGWFGFSTTIYDTVVSESLLDLLSLPFALTFLTGNHPNDSSSCNLQGYQPTDNPIHFMHSSFGYATFAGATSAIIAVWFLVMSLNEHIYTKQIDEEEEEDFEKIDSERHGYFSRMGLRLVSEKKLIIPMVIAMSSFISNWVLWGSEFSFTFPDALRIVVLANHVSDIVAFIHVAGDSYCEAGTVETGISWVVVILIHPILRAVSGN